MTANGIARHYSALTPEERFRLIVAAGARNDELEQERLISAGQRITLSMPDHTPYSHAFLELAPTIFIELVEHAAHFLAMGDRFLESLDEDFATDECESDNADSSPVDHANELYFAAGFILKTKAAAWNCFCERMGIPPLAVWDGLPGLDRLQQTVELAHQMSFAAEGMVCWLNRIRPEDRPEATEANIISPKSLADELDKVFRQRAQWWGG